ncbi:NAD(+)/NADH kinase [Defluviitalea phaphyphila]|uniref:NAD(+)/NADH kinase n=1 Tax=Defluviitalea phaphyphila TaxID=1473580 RepID=UPI0007312007|nr:NAD(+)/NADH kinase [Defluviitalea phaphyphila]
MKTIGLISNTKKDIKLKNTSMIIDWLLKKNCNIYIPENISNILNAPNLEKEENKIYKESDFIIVLGGDGTFLRAAREASLYNTPILGINLGTLGFLTEVDKNSSFTVLEKVLNGEYYIETRMMLETNVNNNKNHLISLNDVVISRSSLSRIIDFKIYINDKFVDNYTADGVIISSPTGSTAYNLSAGGPILEPSTNMMGITPICPHSLYARSIVVSSEDIITIEIGENLYFDIILTIDGQMGYRLKNNDIVSIKKSHYKTHLIRTKEYNFYDVLRKKLLG